MIDAISQYNIIVLLPCNFFESFFFYFEFDDFKKWGKGSIIVRIAYVLNTIFVKHKIFKQDINKVYFGVLNYICIVFNFDDYHYV